MTSDLRAVADEVWIATDPARILGMRLTATMTVVRLGDGGLLLYSPLALTPARRSEIEQLGALRHLIAPNLFHHLHAGSWHGAFPDAVLSAPAGLADKRPDLRIDRTLPGHPLGDDVQLVEIEGFRLTETVLFHRPSGTLVVADLVHHVGRPDHLWSSIYTRLMGFHDRVALSRMIRWTAFDDRTAARRSLERVLDLPFERLIVGHGTPLEQGARDALAGAFDWLLS